MLRRLLACLALLTGLTVTGMPAYAQAVAESTARLEASVSAAAVPTRPAVTMAGIYNPAESTPSGHRKPVFSTAPRAPMPPVFVGIDRARE